MLTYRISGSGDDAIPEYLSLRSGLTASSAVTIQSCYGVAGVPISLVANSPVGRRRTADKPDVSNERKIPVSGLGPPKPLSRCGSKDCINVEEVNVEETREKNRSRRRLTPHIVSTYSDQASEPQFVGTSEIQQHRQPVSHSSPDQLRASIMNSEQLVQPRAVTKCQRPESSIVDSCGIDAQQQHRDKTSSHGTRTNKSNMGQISESIDRRSQGMFDANLRRAERGIPQGTVLHRNEARMTSGLALLGEDRKMGYVVYQNSFVGKEMEESRNLSLNNILNDDGIGDREFSKKTRPEDENHAMRKDKCCGL